MKRSQKLTSLMEQSYEETLHVMLSKLDDHFMSQPLPKELYDYDSYLNYLHEHIIVHKTVSDIPGLEEKAKKIILNHYKRLSKGDRFAFLTYIAESETYPDQKVISTPSTDEVWQYVFGIWGGNMIAGYYRK